MDVIVCRRCGMPTLRPVGTTRDLSSDGICPDCFERFTRGLQQVIAVTRKKHNAAGDATGGADQN